MERGEGPLAKCPHCGSSLQSGEEHKDHNACLDAHDRRLERLEAAAAFARARQPDEQ